MAERNKQKQDKLVIEQVTPDDQIRDSIGRKIKQIRDMRRQSAERVAKKIGINRVSLTHIENGRNNVSGLQLWKLACVLGCDIQDFFPSIPQGYALTRSDYSKVAKEDEKAEEWAKTLFGDEI